MKATKFFMGIFVGLSLFATSALADYNRGFKYYNKYIKKKAHLKSNQFIKALGVTTVDELKELFKNNGKALVEKAKQIDPKVAKGIEKIIKKGKLKDLEDFLVGIMQGKIPAGCS